MANQKRPPQEEEQAKKSGALEKKLRKREKRLQERLQDAQKTQARAQERFKRAEARVQKRAADVQRIEERLAAMRQQRAGRTNPQQPAVEHASSGVSGEGAPLADGPGTSATQEEAVEQAREARAAAEAAEMAARQAAERAVEVSSRQGQAVTDGYQEQEPGESQSEVDRATIEAAEAERLAQHAERLAAEQAVEHIEEEEELVSEVAAMMIADVAAAAAAEAEAMAEASSARTREARYAALQADQVLEEVRAAIASGALSGEDADRYLQSAEHEATRAHALLADAEVAEERALNAAMNAEAEAEVAEGMAFAATDQAEEGFEELPLSTQPLINGNEERLQDTSLVEKGVEAHDDDELDDTEELPVITKQEIE